MPVDASGLAARYPALKRIPEEGDLPAGEGSDTASDMLSACIERLPQAFSAAARGTSSRRLPEVPVEVLRPIASTGSMAESFSRLALTCR